MSSPRETIEGADETSSLSDFTHLIIGTSLPLAILSAALSLDPASRVLHIDANDYYGGRNASLNLSQLVDHLSKGGDHTSSRLSFPYFEASQSSSSSAPLPEALRTLDRHYSVSISPSLQPSVSHSLDVLIRSGVAKYATFRLLQRTAVWEDDNTGHGKLRTVPSSKEDIFKTPNSELSLLDKRRVMKFLQSCISETELADISDAPVSIASLLEERFGIKGRLADAVMYGIALSSNGSSEPASQVVNRVRTHLQSSGRYGNSAYLVPQYGGAGELAQGYCRVAAVHGATFVLGKHIRSLEKDDENPVYRLTLDDVDETFQARTIIGLEDSLQGYIADRSPPASATSRAGSGFTLQGILILDRGLRFPSVAGSSEATLGESTTGEEPIETGLIVFPPKTLAQQCNADTVTALVLGEGTFCCPKGQYVVHLTTELSEADAVYEAHANSIFAAAKDQVLELAKGSKVEWSPPTSEGATSSATPLSEEAVLPLVEAVWIQKAASEDRDTFAVLDASVLTAASATATHGVSPSAGTTSQSSLTSLLDGSTLQAEALFYRLHGLLDQSEYPDASKRRKGQLRHPSEYLGRAGAGPDLDADDEESGQTESQHEKTTPLFFPRQDANDGEEDDQ